MYKDSDQFTSHTYDTAAYQTRFNKTLGENSRFVSQKQDM